jgi:predicted RNase H-like HicB family nuclease
MPDLKYHIETEEEEDGRWIAEIVDLPGVMAYGATKEEAMAAAEAMALRVIADRIEEQKIGAASVSFACT